VKDPDVFEIVAQIGPFIGTQNSERKAHDGPEMKRVISTAVMFFQVVYLGVAVVTGSNAVIGSGSPDLFVFDSAVCPAGFGKPGLQETTATPTAVVVRPVGGHIDKILFTDAGFGHIAQVFGDGIAEGLAHQLTGILYGEFDFPVLVPIRAGFQFAFAYPAGVILDDALDLEIVRDLELVQSDPD
jgi:hypothetical protein